MGLLVCTCRSRESSAVPCTLLEDIAEGRMMSTPQSATRGGYLQIFPKLRVDPTAELMTKKCVQQLGFQQPMTVRRHVLHLNTQFYSPIALPVGEQAIRCVSD